MTTKHILKWVDRVFKSSWKRHKKTLSFLIVACFRAPRLCLTALGREMPLSIAPKHAIKRVDRFLGGRHFEHTQAREDWARFVVGRRKRVSIARIMALYGQRFRIEESFRDQKSWRCGHG